MKYFGPTSDPVCRRSHWDQIILFSWDIYKNWGREPPAHPPLDPLLQACAASFFFALKLKMMFVQ